jgi:CBS domain-containing protein
MRDQVVVCAPDAPLAEVAQVMLAEHIHRIIVVEGERPVGIISSLDLVKVLASQLSNGAEN